MNSSFLLEIAANSTGSALAAQAGGAGRIELCGNLDEGGTTPSYGVLAVVRERLRIPLFVLIRPRVGDFLYEEFELESMRRDIQACKELGCDGIVIGALDADGAVDVANCRELIAAAGSMSVTFHRAFDVVRDQEQALKDVISLGCHRVLTSGARPSALEGADTISALVRQAGHRLGVVAGAGVTADNLPELIERTRAREFHASATTTQRSKMRWRSSILRGLQADYVGSDVDRIRRMVQILQKEPHRSPP
jgi:copper homeostasis protein